MKGLIDEDSLLTEPERNNAPSPLSMSGTLHRKMAKRTCPWLPAPVAAATLPSTSTSSRRDADADADLPVAKKSRLLAPFPAAEVEPTVQWKHNSYKEYRKEWPAVAPVAPVPVNMQLRGLSGWHPSHPSIYPMTEYTGTSIADQASTLNNFNSTNGYASTVARGLGQASSPCWNTWTSQSSTWHPTTTQATDLTVTWTADQLHLLQILQGMNGSASTVVGGVGQTTSPFWDGWSPRGSDWHPTIAQAAGLTGMQRVDQGSIFETQQNGINRYASLARGLHQATTSPRWDGLSSRDSTWDPTVTHAAELPGLAGMRTAHQDSPLDARLELDLCQLTTRTCQNRFHISTPVDRTTGRWTSEEAGIDWTTERKGTWTPDEDRMLVHAVEKFAATRWKTIAALIPGRTKKQCWNRWQYALDPSILQTTERTGKWIREEDDKLVAAVQKHNGKNWDAIAELVLSRTKRQCMDRWHKVLSSLE
jgi:hypothetical protein